MFLARVFITLKPTVNDPEGQTIRSGLLDMGYGSVAAVRAGKYMEVSLDEDSEAEAASHVRHDDPYPCVVEPEAFGQPGSRDVRHLRCAVNDELL